MFLGPQRGVILEYRTFGNSVTAHLSDCTFLGFQIRRGRIVWTEKALQRFKERIQEITSRSRGVSSFCMLRELRRYM